VNYVAFRFKNYADQNFGQLSPRAVSAVSDRFLPLLGIAARHPDETLLELLDSAVNEFCVAARLKRHALKQLRTTVDQSPARLAAVGLPQTADRLSN
jgi:hypothetical protein